jgi:CRISPR-associated protein Cas2
MLYLISYDIPVDKRRTRVATLLEGHGRRVLESVFECDLTGAEYQQLQRKLSRRIKPDDGDRLRIYRLCRSCTEQIEIIGEGPPVERSADVYIF